MIVSNLLDKERKTIGKLTGLNEDLRRDRMEYMAKTNAALQSHKEMIQKTGSKLDETLYADIIGLINKLDSDEFLTDKEALYNALEAKKAEYNAQNGV